MSRKGEDVPFAVTEVNHAALRVRDIDASKAFYTEMFGGRVMSASTTACFMALPNGEFIAMFPSDDPPIEHSCLTLPDYDADVVARRLEERGHVAVRQEDRIFIRDPDGLLVQLSGPNARRRLLVSRSSGSARYAYHPSRWRGSGAKARSC